MFWHFPGYLGAGGGTLTAGNSTPLTDGASAVLLCSESWARERGLPIAAYLTYAREAAVDFVHGEGLLMAPAYAVSDMLKEANLALQDFDFYEIHEAFAAQVLGCLAAWKSDDYCKTELGLDGALGEMNEAVLNAEGGAIALGHPVGASGTRIVLHLLHALKRTGKKRGMAAICIGGGLGGAMLVEAL